MPLAEVCQLFTTFTTKYGNYKFTRAPMGPTNIPGQYQKAMVTEVFPDYVTRIMEIYLDDLLTWSKDIPELIERLGLIFARLRQFNITLNPEKCRFGMNEVEYVGHLISSKGITFSTDKKNQVANFELPKTWGALKSFCGLASYFRRHVKGYAELVHPLQEMLEGYEKRFKGRPIEWTSVTENHYRMVQNAIVNCQLLYFRDPSAPVRLYTDASDYGIGAYLCQVTDSVEYPVSFISKTLSKVEKRWSVYEKEAFAIFYALRKWEYYLRDIKFVLFTDHKNLTYLNNDPSPKVQRWKIAVQQYDFDIAYIEGEKNTVADGFSRFCPQDLTEEAEEEDAAFINSIVMFLDCYPSQEKLIDSLLSKGTEEREREVFRINPDYETEAKQYLNDRNAHISALKASTDIALPGPKRTRLFTSYEERSYYHIPTEFYQIISSCHNSTVGHFGVEPTISLVTKLIHDNPEKFKDLKWMSLRKDVDSFVKHCPTCQLNKIHRLRVETKKYTTSKFGVLKNLSIDAIYMPNSKSLFKYILVIIDSCTRYVQLHPMRDLSAASAAQLLMKHMRTYGTPNEICTDNASQFQSVFEELLQILRINNYKIQAYSHQENSIVERANQEVERHLRNVMFDKKVIDEWPEYLPLVEQILNSHINKSTGVATVDIIFAGQVDLNRGLLFPPTLHPKEQPLSTYMEKLLENQERILQLMYKSQKAKDMFHVARNSATNITDFPVNSYVTAAYENDEHRPPSKIHNRRRGPFKVLKKTERAEGDVYTCVDLITHKEYDFHVKLLTEFYYDPVHTDLIEVATTERQTFIVDQVIGHGWIDEEFAESAKGRCPSNLKLHIKWRGYEIPEWNKYDEPSIKKVQKVIDYLTDHKLLHLVPHKLRAHQRKRKASELNS